MPPKTKPNSNPAKLTKEVTQEVQLSHMTRDAADIADEVRNQTLAVVVDLQLVSTKLRKRLLKASQVQTVNNGNVDPIQRHHDQLLLKRGLCIVQGVQSDNIVDKLYQSHKVHSSEHPVLASTRAVEDTEIDELDELVWYFPWGQEISTFPDLIQTLISSINKWTGKGLDEEIKTWLKSLNHLMEKHFPLRDELLISGPDAAGDFSEFLNDLTIIVEQIAHKKFLHLIIPKCPNSKRINNWLHDLISRDVTNVTPAMHFDIGMTATPSESQKILNIGEKYQQRKFTPSRIFIKTHDYGLHSPAEPTKRMMDTEEREIQINLRKSTEIQNRKQRQKKITETYEDVKRTLDDNKEDWENDKLFSVGWMLLQFLKNNLTILRNNGIDVRHEIFDLYQFLFKYGKADAIEELVNDAMLFTKNSIFSSTPKKSLKVKAPVLQKQLDQMRIFNQLAKYIPLSTIEPILKRVFALVPELPKRAGIFNGLWGALEWNKKFTKKHEVNNEFLTIFADQIESQTLPDELLNLLCDFFATVARRFALNEELLPAVALCDVMCRYFVSLQEKGKSLPAEHVLTFNAMLLGAQTVLWRGEPVVGRSPERKKLMQESQEVLQKVYTATKAAKGAAAVARAAPYFVSLFNARQGVDAQSLAELHDELVHTDKDDLFTTGSLVASAATLVPHVGGAFDQYSFMDRIFKLTQSNQAKNVFIPDQPLQVAVIAGMLRTSSLLEVDPDPRLYSPEEIEQMWEEAVNAKSYDVVINIVNAYQGSATNRILPKEQTIAGIFEEIKNLPKQYDQLLVILGLQNSSENSLAHVLMARIYIALIENDIDKAEALGNLFVKLKLWKIRLGFPYKLDADMLLAVTATRFKQKYERPSDLEKYLKSPSVSAQFFKKSVNSFAGGSLAKLGPKHDAENYWKDVPQFSTNANLLLVALEYLEKGKDAADLLFRRLFENDCESIPSAFAYLNAAHMDLNAITAQQAFRIYEQNNAVAMKRRIKTQFPEIVESAEQEKVDEVVVAIKKIDEWQKTITKSLLVSMAQSKYVLLLERSSNHGTGTASNDDHDTSFSERSLVTSSSTTAPIPSKVQQITKKTQEEPQKTQDDAKRKIISSFENKLATNRIFTLIRNYISAAGLQQYIDEAYFITESDGKFHTRMQATWKEAVLQNLEIINEPSDPNVIPCDALKLPTVNTSFGWTIAMHPHGVLDMDRVFDPDIRHSGRPVIFIGTRQGTLMIRLNTVPLDGEIPKDYNWLAHFETALQHLPALPLTRETDIIDEFTRLPGNPINFVNGLDVEKILYAIDKYYNQVKNPLEMAAQIKVIKQFFLNPTGVINDNLVTALIAQEKIYFKALIEVAGYEQAIERLTSSDSLYLGLGDVKSIGAFLHNRVAFENLLFVLLVDLYNETDDDDLKKNILRTIRKNIHDLNLTSVDSICLMSDLGMLDSNKRIINNPEIVIVPSEIFVNSERHVFKIIADNVKDNDGYKNYIKDLSTPKSSMETRGSSEVPNNLRDLRNENQGQSKDLSSGTPRESSLLLTGTTPQQTAPLTKQFSRVGL